MANDRQIMAIAETVDCDLQMHVALAPQDHFATILVLLELERRVFVDQLGDRARQFDVVAALLGMNRKAEYRLQPFWLWQFVGLARRSQHGAGRNLLHAGEPDNLANTGGSHLLMGRPGDAHDARDAHAV